MTGQDGVPASVWAEVYHLQFALADLTRALLTSDDTYIVRDLEKIESQRARLVNACQSWRPSLRISAHEAPIATGHDFWATLRPESARATAWQRVFGSEARVPIAAPVAEMVELPIGVREVLFIATDQLTQDQKERLIRHLATAFDVDPQEVQDNIERDPRHSVPVLNEDVSITVLHPQRWL